MADGNESRETVSDKIRRNLLFKLLEEHFSCGQRLNESLLAHEFGVSRQVVREVLCQAIGWGVVEYVPFCGFQIRDFSIREIVDWYKLRLAIEPSAAREIAEHRPEAVLGKLAECCERERNAFAAGDSDAFSTANREFHRTIVSECGNTQYAKPAILACFAVCFNFEFDFRRELMFFNIDSDDGEEIVTEAERRKIMLREKSSTMQQDAITLGILSAGDADQAEKRVRWYVQGVVSSIGRCFEAFGDTDTPFSRLRKSYLKYFRKSARKPSQFADAWLSRNESK